MRIAILMSLGSPWAREIAGHLAELGHEIHVIAYRHSSDGSYLSLDDVFQAAAIASLGQSVAGVHPAKVIGFGSARYLHLAAKMASLLRRLRPDVLFTLSGGGFAAAAYLSGFRPYAVYATGSDILLGSLAKKKMSRHFLTAACVVFSNGQYLGEKTRELAPRAAVVPIYHGIDPQKFAPGCPAPLPVRILCTRGFLPIYNNELLVRALAHINNSFEDYETVFAAPGPQLNAANRLADAILLPAQRQRVRFLGGVSREEMADLLRQSHVYVSMSKSDGTSTSLLEALACGLFPILSDIPPNREWIYSNAANGILVSPGDSAALAAALTRAITGVRGRREAGQFNRQLILDRADTRANLPFLASVLESRVEDARTQNPWRAPSAVSEK
ncbi:MAG: glycosyltransferase [Candidatus Acidiferrales bacterium]